MLEQGGAKIVKSYDTPDWSPDKAQQEMEQTITALGKNGFDAVYVANDGMAGGAIAAMKAAGIDPAKLFVTGQDAEVAGVQRILAGEQLMTVYQPIKKIAAHVGRDRRAAGRRASRPAEASRPSKTDNGAGPGARRCCSPRSSIDKDNINDTVVKDGFLEGGRRSAPAPTRRPARTPASSERARSSPRKLVATRSPKGEQLRAILGGPDRVAAARRSPLPSERELAERYERRADDRARRDRPAGRGGPGRRASRAAARSSPRPRVAQAAALSSFTEDMRARGPDAGLAGPAAQGVEPADDLVAGAARARARRAGRARRRVRTADGEPMALEEAFLPAERFGALAERGPRAALAVRACWRSASARASRRPTSAWSRSRSSARTPTCSASRPGRAGLQFHTILLDEDERPVAYAWSLFRGDRYEIRLRQERASVSAGVQMAAEMAEQPRVLARSAAPSRRAGRARCARVGAARLPGSCSSRAARPTTPRSSGATCWSWRRGRPVALAAPQPADALRRRRTDLDGWLAVGVSQSGRTPEIVTVLERFGAAGARTVADHQRPRQPAGRARPTRRSTPRAGAERAVPATKTVTAQLAAFAVLAEALAATRARLPWDADAWAALPDAVGELLADAEPAARRGAAVGAAQGLVAIARGLLLGAALEAALKLQGDDRRARRGLRRPPTSATARSPVVRREPAGADARAPAARRRPTSPSSPRGCASAAAGAAPRRRRLAPTLPFPPVCAEPLAAIPAIVRAQQLARAVALPRGHRSRRAARAGEGHADDVVPESGGRRSGGPPDSLSGTYISERCDRRRDGRRCSLRTYRGAAAHNTQL